MSCAIKEKWQDKKYREKTIKAQRKGMNLKPTIPEKQLNKILYQLFLNEYKYIGDGKVWVDRFNPDFINKDNNKIIEMYGDYWHNLFDYKKRDKCRLIAYKKLGYKTLIIWQHELKNLKQVKEKLINFNKI